MQEAAGPLPGWESFYVIVGSSAAVLTGLQFVVITLVTEVRRTGSLKEIDAFATPTIVHFALALLVSATMSAPWHGLTGAAVAIGVTGLGGVIYTGLVVRRARRQTGYAPVLEDWSWHIAFPLVAYATLLIAASLLRVRDTTALFGIGAAALLLLFIGIHNAWDTTTWIVSARFAESGTTASSPSATSANTTTSQSSVESSSGVTP